MLFTIQMSDTITLRRTVEMTVEADDIEEARDLAYDGADVAMSGEGVEEEQINNTPYQMMSIYPQDLPPLTSD